MYKVAFFCLFSSLCPQNYQKQKKAVLNPIRTALKLTRSCGMLVSAQPLINFTSCCQERVDEVWEGFMGRYGASRQINNIFLIL